MSAKIMKKNREERKPDVTIEGGGSVYLFTPHTDMAREWIKENVSEDRQFFGKSLVVEHRYAADLAVAMVGDGLEVQ